MLRDAAELIEVAGPQIGLVIIFFLGIVALVVMIWRSVSAERRLRIQFANQQETNRVSLEKAKLELESSRQKSDATETSSLHKIFEKFVDIQAEQQRQSGEQIASRNELQQMVKALQSKTENFGNWMALASENTEAFQAWARGQVQAAEQRGIETKLILEPVPNKLETILEVTTAAKTAAKSAEQEIRTVGANVVDAISKLTAIETMLHTIEQSVGKMKADLIQSTVASPDEPPAIDVLVASITEPETKPE